MKLTKLFLLACFFGLLCGAKLVNESLIVFRSIEVAQQYEKGPDDQSRARVSSLGEAFMVMGMVFAAGFDAGALPAMAAQATAQLLLGCGLVAAALLGLVLRLIFHLRAKKNLARNQRGERGRRSP
jgi:xanthine/uracil permease